MQSIAGPAHRVQTWTRLIAALVMGAIGGIASPGALGSTLPARGLSGFVIGALVLSVPLLWHIMRWDAQRTEQVFDAAQPTRSIVDIVVVVGGLASLGAIVIMLTGQAPQDSKAAEAALTVAAVGSAWVSIHTAYTLRYARHYFGSEPGSVDFNTTTSPRLSDFAYLAFTLGMTYQVSDTDLKTPAIRRLVLEHTLLSYVFGTGIIAATINLVAGLAK